MKKIIIMVASSFLFATAAWAQQMETVALSDLPEAVAGRALRIQYGFPRNGYWEYGLTTESGSWDQWIRVYRGNQQALVERKLNAVCEAKKKCQLSVVKSAYGVNVLPSKFILVPNAQQNNCWLYTILSYRGVTIVVREVLRKDYLLAVGDSIYPNIFNKAAPNDRKIAEALIQLQNNRTKPFYVSGGGVYQADAREKRNRPEAW